MPKYWLVCGDQEDLVISPDKKGAHEKGQVMFPGQTVEVFAAEERRLLDAADDFDEEVSDAIESIEYEIKEDTDLDTVLNCAERIERAITKLREVVFTIEWERGRLGPT